MKYLDIEDVVLVLLFVVNRFLSTDDVALKRGNWILIHVFHLSLSIILVQLFVPSVNIIVHCFWIIKSRYILEWLYNIYIYIYASLILFNQTHLIIIYINKKEQGKKKEEKKDKLWAAVVVRIVNAGLWAFYWACPSPSSPSSSPSLALSFGSSGNICEFMEYFLFIEYKILYVFICWYKLIIKWFLIWFVIFECNIGCC